MTLLLRSAPVQLQLLYSPEWSQVTHIPTSIKSGGAYKPERSVLSPLRQALHTQIANCHIQRARKSFKCFFFFLSVGGFLQSSAQPHGSATLNYANFSHE